MKQFRLRTLRILPMILALNFAAGCESKHTSSSSRSVNSNTLPKAETYELLSGQILTPHAAFTDFFLTPTHPTSNAGLRTVFHLSTSATNKQILGIITSSSSTIHSVQARTTSGTMIFCSSPQSENSLKQQQTKTFQFSCNGHLLEIILSKESYSEEIANHHFTKQSLIAGASLTLSSNDEEIELTLKANELILFTSKQMHKIQISEKQLNALFSERESFNFNLEVSCPNSDCQQPSREAYTLTLNEGRPILSKSTTQSTNSLVFTLRNEKSIRVASYNVENFWDNVSDNSQPYADFSALTSNWYKDNLAFSKAERIRSALLAAGLPDVVGLQEIESANNDSRSLELLMPLLAPLGYHYYALGLQSSDNPTAVTTAVVSKYPILENSRIDFLFAPQELSDEDKKDFVGASRDPQRITVALPDDHYFALINSHWKSKRDKSPYGDIMRKALAQIIREHITSLKNANGSKAHAILMGDFNADYREAPVQEGLALASSIASARRGENNASLVPLWLTLPPPLQGDYPHDSHYQALDNIVVTASLLKPGGLSLTRELHIVGREGYAAQILANGDGLPLRSQVRKYKDSDNQIQSTHFNDGFSDHLPIVATFSRSAEKQPTTFNDQIENQTIAELPAVEIGGSSCAEHKVSTLSATDLLSAQRGECVYLENVSFSLQKTGLFNIYFNPLETSYGESTREIKVVVTADRAFGANKNWLRAVLQSSEGKKLTKIRGRLGVMEGHKAIYIHSPSDDIELAE